MSDVRILSAACLCGQVVFKIEDSFLIAGYCHCKECQKFSGSPFSAWGRIERDKVGFESGGSLIKHYHKNETGRVAFCSHCGSSLYNEQVDQNLLNIRLGILDDEPSAKPSMHVYADSRAPWHEITDTLRKFDTLPGRD